MSELKVYKIDFKTVLSGTVSVLATSEEDAKREFQEMVEMDQNMDGSIFASYMGYDDEDIISITADSELEITVVRPSTDDPAKHPRYEDKVEAEEES